MRFYRVTDGRTSGQPDYYPSLEAAHKAAKEFFYRFDAEIIEVEVDTDKAGVLKLLNFEGGVEAEQLRRFCLTPRGGLRPSEPEVA